LFSFGWVSSVCCSVGCLFFFGSFEDIFSFKSPKKKLGLFYDIFDIFF
jgi:hypothetical protein